MPSMKHLGLLMVAALSCTPETVSESSTSNASTAQRTSKSAGTGGAAAPVGGTAAPAMASVSGAAGFAVPDKPKSATAYLEGFREPAAGAGGAAANGGRGGSGGMGAGGAGGSEAAGKGGAGAGGSGTSNRTRGPMPTTPPAGNRRNGGGAMGGAGAGGSARAGAGGGGGGGMGGVGVAGGVGGAGGAGGAGGGRALEQEPSAVTASAVFTPRSDGIELGVAISKCESGKRYPVRIQDGMGCAGEMMQGKIWDDPRGVGIPDVPCDGSTLMYTRQTSDAKPWSIGPPMTSNVVGRLLVMYDPDDHDLPIICGEIHSP